jgi:uncharacterized lipoprotein YddW (UPF0748 family)
MVVSGAAAVCVFAAQIKVLDDFKYPDVVAARAAWVSVESTAPAELMPVEGGGQALKIPCDYTRENLRRAGYDLHTQLDLSTYGAFTFDFYCDDTRAISYCSIYFHAVDGWYTCLFPFAKGWTHVSLSKAQFGMEGTPAGWDKVDTIRISTWKGRPRDTFCAVAKLAARSEDIAIVQGSAAGDEAATEKSVAEHLSNLLFVAGVPFGGLNDQDVEAGALKGKKIAIFGYSPVMSDKAADEVEKFVAAGGKVVVCYTVHPRVMKLLGVAALEYQAARPPGRFAEITFEGAGIEGMPAALRQDSWNANIPTPAEGAKVIGVWQDLAKQKNGAAVVLNENGAYMGHIITEGDDEAKRMFLLALIGHFVPSAWEEAANSALARGMQIGPFAKRADFAAWLAARPDKARFAATVNGRLAAADAAEQKARAALGEKRYVEVLRQAALMRDDCSAAYIAAHIPRDGEFRAVWNHSGTGDCGTWDEAMKRLAAANFNAVVPNMWWGGLAYYKSKILPVAKWVEEKGDPLEQAVAAGRKYGIEVHPWKVNWNLANAPQEFLDQMKAEHRLMIGHTGEERKWLCPSNLANLKLETDTMLEVARNYDVDGIHFDYIRYPDEDGCFCDTCRAAFETARGKAVEKWPEDCYSGALRQEYLDWRCTNITRLVKAVSEEAHRIKPYLKVSAAVFADYPSCKEYVGQDWVLWCRNGWLDFVCPMDYNGNDATFETWVSNQVGLVGGRIPVYTGIGQFIIPDDQVVGQMEISRACGADGVILFNMGQALSEVTLPKLASAITSTKAVLPHKAPLVQFATDEDRDAPLTEVAGDKLTVRVELTSLGQHRVKATAATGTIELQDLSGITLQKLGPLPALGEGASFDIAKREGAFRLAAVGEMTFADGTKARFIRRSRPYQFGVR